MKIPKNYFLVQVEKAYDDTIEFNGREIFLDIKFDAQLNIFLVDL